ncbi:MAG TPA: DUF2490 domain-containing protein [Saprospiraceae bacterium]|nr:DUF2490 domain-containing protein [Saprospiraceae bacterium]HND87186.1 DUF2490 domain-containing protein [Saprospiraceae bacterium]HNG88788.1 DUF2490 domain-containing protein [Saprospiraceae bacterium]
MKRTLFALLFLLVGTGAAVAQRQHTTNRNSWLMYFGDHKFSPHWGLHVEAQLRRSDGVNIGQQLLLRPGINYHFSPALFASAGYCFVQTYPYGEFAAKSSFPEHRLWEQLQFKNVTGRLEWINRLRLEQRWVDAPTLQGSTYQPGPAVYSNRMRLLNRVSLPLHGKSIEDKTWYLSAYDEVFLGFGKNVALNILDQNRAYAALGYKVPRLGRVELGYLFQRVFKADGVKTENNHTLMLGLASTLPLHT